MAIKIVYYTETIDNWGRTESSSKPDILFNVLNNTEDFNDDMIFEGEHGERYFIDDLIGKKVLVEGIGIFTVPSDEN